MNDTPKKYNMKINVQKTKAMVVTRDGGGEVNVKIDGQRLEQVTNLKYLESIISGDERNLVGIKTRIVLAKQAFNNRKKFLTKQMKKPLKKRMIRKLMCPVALYTYI